MGSGGGGIIKVAAVLSFHCKLLKRLGGIPLILENYTRAEQYLSQLI